MPVGFAGPAAAAGDAAVARRAGVFRAARLALVFASRPQRGARAAREGRHDRLADRGRGLVDFLDARDGRIAGVVGACRLRSKLDKEALGARRKQKNDAAVLARAVLDIVRLAVDLVQRALVHVDVFDAGEAGRHRAPGMRVDRVAGAEYRDQNAVLLRGCDRFFELVFQHRLPGR